MTANGSARFGPDWEKYVMSAEETELVDSMNADSETSLLETPETSAAKSTKWGYRDRFMEGKEDEYAATIEAYEKVTALKSANHITALKECRTHATLQRDRGSGDVKVFGDSCRDRWCPLCAGQKALYAKEQTKLYIESLQSPKMLTLTLKHNAAGLEHQVKFLQERFASLRSRAYWKRNVKGGIWYLQVKRGENSDCWHPHLHILLDSNRMEHENLSALWEQVTFGSPVLDIRYIRGDEKMVSYISRYMSRPAVLKDLPLADRVEVIEALFRKRMCGTFGNAKAVTLTPPKIESDETWDYVGHYDDINRKAENDPAARRIMVAYNNYEAISENEYKAFVGKLPGVQWAEPKPKKIDRQMYMDFFKPGNRVGDPGG